MYQDYLKMLGKIPHFLNKYLKCPSLLRLKNIGYFCGMDYASKDVYDFNEYISRYDHSLDVALITYKYTKNKKATIAGLFHDIATPCFSHVIDYMNKDYETQESTEELTEEIIKNDKYLLKCLKEDKIKVEDIINFKKYTIVDNNRPKLCADRLDGVILTGLFWTKNINLDDIKEIFNHLTIYQNEFKELELGFRDYIISKKVRDVSDSIDIICHSNEDNYMMDLLSRLTKYIVEKEYIHYNDLFYLTENNIHNIFNTVSDKYFLKEYDLFKNIKMEEIPYVEMPYIKKRDLNLLVIGKRLK